MELWQTYHNPQTVAEALQILADHQGNGRVIAGGTDLLVDLQHVEKPEEPLVALVDVTAIADMTRIAEEDGYIVIGAAATHTQIVKSALVECSATCLVESCGVVGGPQVRNVGTIGGNVAHALPAGDGTTSLVALDAEADVAWQDGRREWLPITSIFKGPGQSALDSTRDVLVAFRFKPGSEHEGTAFKRIMRPQGVALPVLGCAVWVRLDGDKQRYDDVRVCIAPVAKTPVRAEVIEDTIRGRLTAEDLMDDVIAASRESLKPRTSKYRATAEYRAYMIETLLKQALPLAAERARTGEAHAEGVGMG